jgi:hypothetical protein
MARARASADARGDVVDQEFGDVLSVDAGRFDVPYAQRELGEVVTIGFEGVFR